MQILSPSIRLSVRCSKDWSWIKPILRKPFGSRELSKEALVEWENGFHSIRVCRRSQVQPWTWISLNCVKISFPVHPPIHWQQKRENKHSDLFPARFIFTSFLPPEIYIFCNFRIKPGECRYKLHFLIYAKLCLSSPVLNMCLGSHTGASNGTYKEWWRTYRVKNIWINVTFLHGVALYQW